MDGIEAAHRRLRSQHLTGPRLTDPAAVVSWLGAVQAQEFTVAKWSVGQRTADADDSAVQRALDEGAILRTHILRPTWHFVAAADLALILRVTGARVHALNAYYYRLHGLDADTDAVVYPLLTNALRGGTQLTRAELAQALAEGGFPATGNKLAYVIIRAELDALLTSGAMRGKQQTYALVSERIPAARQTDSADPDADLAELIRRYFTSHGPATVKDFAWWSSLTVTQVRRGLAAAGLSSATVDGLTLWYAPGTPPDPAPSPAAHVLQGYDEYVVAYTESRQLTNLARRQLPAIRENILVHSVVLDSQLVGLWRREVGPTGIVARLRVAEALSSAQTAAVETAFGRYAAFAGTPVTVIWE